MEKIDAVITWVDGSEPNYQKKLKEYLADDNQLKRRYIQANEINLCVASIVKYAPFIRKIFIVTDKQSPNLDNIKHIVSKEKVEIVDHEEIFRHNIEFLPTFNIRSIDALLFKIKDLSEKFIYFNDDMFLIKNLLKIRPSFNAAQSKAANIVGFQNRYFKSYHCGRPQIKSVIKDFYDKNPEKLVDQIRYKFRDSRQYMPYSLCWHLLIKKKLFIESPISKLIEIKKARELSPNQLISLLNKIDSQANIKFLNIQDLNLASDITQQVFQNWFFEKLKK